MNAPGYEPGTLGDRQPLHPRWQPLLRARTSSAACATPWPMRATASRPAPGTSRALDLAAARGAGHRLLHAARAGRRTATARPDRGRLRACAAADPEPLQGRRRRRSRTCSRPRRSWRPRAPRPRTPACVAPRPNMPSRCWWGGRPSAFSIAARAAPTPWRRCRSVDPGLPSQLLERRPDVAAAERRVAAANANIGVARAAYFPSLQPVRVRRLPEHAELATGCTRPSQFWSLGPQAVLTLFDGGPAPGPVRAGARRLR